MDGLRRAIKTGLFAPGQRLIEIIPCRGPMVRRISRAEAVSMYNVRAAAKAAAQHIERAAAAALKAIPPDRVRLQC